MMKSSRLLPWRALAFAAAVATACSDSNAPSLTVGSITVSTFNHLLASAGVPVELNAVVLGPSDAPVPTGTSVAWSLPQNRGSLSAGVTTTDQHGVARVTWTPPTTLGPVDVRVVVGGIPSATVTTPITVTFGPPKRVVLDADSIRFTRKQNQLLPLHVLDAYDHEYTFMPPGVQVVSSGTFNGATSEPFGIPVLTVMPGDSTTSVGELLLQTTTGIELARLKVVVDLIIHSVQVTGVDSLGLTVGESVPVSIVARDSSGAIISASAQKADVTLSSADPSIVSVNATGAITGVAAGTTIVTAERLGGLLNTDTIEVLAAYDYGALTKLYDIPVSVDFPLVSAPVFSDLGRSLHIYGGGGHGTPLTTIVSWYGAEGLRMTTRTYAAGAGVARGPDNGWFVSRPLTAYDALATQLWTRPIQGRGITADASLLVVGLDDGAVRGFSPSGDSLWTAQMPASVAASEVLLTTSRVFALGSGTLAAFDRGGNMVWNVSAPALTLADDSSWTYSVTCYEASARDASGVIQWSKDYPPGTCLGASSLGPNNSILLLRSRTLMSVDRATGSERWRVEIPVFGAGTNVAVIGGKLMVSNVYVWVYDAATGAPLGRSTARLAQSSLGFSAARPTCTDLGLAVSTRSAYRWARCQ